MNLNKKSYLHIFLSVEGKKRRRRIVMADDENDSSTDESANRENILASTHIENHDQDTSTR